MRIRTLSLCSLISVLTACSGGGGKSTTAPTAPGGAAIDPACAPSSSNLNCSPATSLAVTIRVSATSGSGDGPFSYAVGGLTMTGTGTQYARIVGLSPGTIEVTGDMRTPSLQFQVGTPPTNVGGSVVSGSVQNVEGPTTGVSACGVQYLNTSGGAPAVRFRFTLNAQGGGPNDPICRQ